MKKILTLIAAFGLMGCSTTPHFKASHKIKYTVENVDGVNVEPVKQIV